MADPPQHGVDELARGPRRAPPGPARRSPRPPRESGTRIASSWWAPRPQHVEHRGVDRVERPVDAGGEHRVVGASPAQRAVGELGGERRVAAVQRPGSRSRPGMRQVGVGVPLVDGAEQVEGDPARRSPGCGLPRPGVTGAAAAPESRPVGRSREPGSAVEAAHAAGPVGRGHRRACRAGGPRPAAPAAVAAADAAPPAPDPTSPGRRGARDGGSAVDHRDRAEPDAVVGPGRPGARRRRAGADLPVDVERGSRPVDAARRSTVSFGASADAVGGLRPGGELAALQRVEGGDQQPGARVAEPVEQVARSCPAAAWARSARRAPARCRAPPRAGRSSHR